MTTETEPMAANTSGKPDMIVAENVDKWFGDFQALDNVTMSVAEHEIVVIFGPSGVRQVHLHPLPQPPRGARRRAHRGSTASR